MLLPLLLLGNLLLVSRTVDTVAMLQVLRALVLPMLRMLFNICCCLPKQLPLFAADALQQRCKCCNATVILVGCLVRVLGMCAASAADATGTCCQRPELHITAAAAGADLAGSSSSSCCYRVVDGPRPWCTGGWPRAGGWLIGA